MQPKNKLEEVAELLFGYDEMSSIMLIQYKAIKAVKDCQRIQ